LVFLLSDPDYINLELSLRKLCTFIPGKSPYWLNQTALETGSRGRNIRIAWLEISIYQGDKSKLEELLDYASPAFEFETRINAINALQNLNYIDSLHAVHLVKAARHWNPKLSQPAREALNNYYASGPGQPLIEEAMVLEQISPNEIGIYTGKK
jgi:hypothetical protein